MPPPTVVFFFLFLLSPKFTTSTPHTISSGQFTGAFTYDPKSQHFLTTTTTTPFTISSLSDASVLSPLLLPLSLPSPPSSLSIDNSRRILLLALPSPPSLALFSLRPPSFPLISLLPIPTLDEPSSLAFDQSNNAVFLAAGSQIFRHLPESNSTSILSNSPIYTADLTSLVHFSRGFILAGDATGRVFKVDDESGGAKEILVRGKADKNGKVVGLGVRGDGAVVVVREDVVELWRSMDGWTEVTKEDRMVVREGWRAKGVAIREGRRVYVLIVDGEGESRIEEVVWEKEGEGDMVWAFVLLGFGLAYFLFWRFQMRSLVSSINKKNS